MSKANFELPIDNEAAKEVINSWINSWKEELTDKNSLHTSKQ